MRRALALALVAAGVGCSSTAPLAVDAVAPAQVSTLAPTPVVIHGRGFYAVARAAIDDGKHPTLDTSFGVAIGGLTIFSDDVQRLDDTTLAATVPAGLVPGVYDVTVVAPDGRRAIAPHALEVVGPPTLTASATITPSPLSVGMDFTVTLDVINGGGSTALAVTPSDLAISGSAGAHVTAAPAAADIAAGATQSFVYGAHADAPGHLVVTALAAGHDLGGVGVASAPASAEADVNTAPVLTASLAAMPSTISVGQSFSLALTVANGGMSTATAVTPSDPLATGSGTAMRAVAPAAADIAGGTQHVFVWTYLATGAGALTLTTSAAGKDPGGNSVATPSVSASVTIQAAASLAATMAATPATVSTGQTITVTMTVTNGGMVTAKSVAPSLPSLMGSGSAMLLTTPAASDIAAGGSAMFTWTYRATVAGTVTFTSTASGSDANSGATVSSAPATSNVVTIQTAVTLAATVTAAPSTVTVNESFVVEVVVSNAGGTDALAVATTVPAPSGPGAATVQVAAPTQTVPAGQSRTFTWTFKASGAGTTTLTSTANGTDANSMQPITSGPATSKAVTIQAAATLTAALTATPNPVQQGKPVTVTLTITNTGGATVALVTPTLAVTGTSTASVIDGPSPTQATIAGGAQQAFVWHYTPNLPGTLTFTGSAAGNDANTGAAVASPNAAQTITVTRHAQLSTTITAPANVAVGATFTVTMTVSCVFGGFDCKNVTPSALVVGGSTTATLVSGPTPASVAFVADGTNTTFTWQYKAGPPGTLTFTGNATCLDNVDNTLVTSPTVTSNVVIVGNPARLAATLTMPASLTRGQQFTVTLTLTNAGGATASTVTPTALTASGTGAASFVSGPTPPSTNVGSGGGTATTTWTYLATVDGMLALSGSATGTDAGNGNSVSTSFVSNTATIRDVGLLFTDPFADGTPFLNVADYAGFLYLGPRQSGAGALRANPDGTSPAAVSFSFPVDVTGHAMTNTSSPPFPSIGASGCAANSAACGPDNEDGRGIFTTATFGGSPWLVVAGAKSTTTTYVYLTSSATTAPSLPYVDLSAVASGAPFGATATHAFRNQLYVGFGAAAGPSLVRLSTTPTAPGLDAVAGTDATDLAVGGSLLAGAGAIADVIADFGDRLYVASAGGCLASTNNAPRPFAAFPADWTACTPATDPLPTVHTAKTSAIEPADRAHPAAVAFGGRLYLARNTTSGPQLFACAPSLSGDPAVCDPADFTLVARNSQGNVALTQFDDAGNGAITLLVATAGHLWVGFNNAAGVQLYRSSVATPLVRGDFEGAGGCSAALHPSNCAPFGSSGFGDASSVRIFDASAVGGTRLIVTTGNGAVGGRVFAATD